MDTLLIAITLTALALAIASGAWLVKVLADERRRSDARVEGLRRAALTTRRTPVDDAPLRVQPAVEPARPGGDLFAAAPSASRRGARAAATLAAAAILAVLAFAVLGRGGTQASTDVAATATPRSSRLELLSLRHEQQDGKLSIGGLVQNPAEAAALTGVSVVAQAFAADGSALGSARAPLDLISLQPGEESPFVVDVLVEAPAARYRIGFRDARDRVVEHLDRRAGATIPTK
jgi:hypothetical protein